MIKDEMFISQVLVIYVELLLLAVRTGEPLSWQVDAH